MYPEESEVAEVQVQKELQHLDFVEVADEDSPGDDHWALVGRDKSS